MEKIMNNIDQALVNEIGSSVVAYAQMIFDSAGCPDDFGVQHSSADYIIFGGTNRLIWRLDSGWSISPKHCSKRFADHFNTKFKEG